MKGFAPFLLILALATAAVANENHPVEIATTIYNGDPQTTRTYSEGSFRELHTSLTTVVRTKDGRIESIRGTVEKRRFRVSLRNFRSVSGLRTDDVRLHADCCASGFAFHWQISFGEPKQCWVDTPEGRELLHDVYDVIYITVTRSGSVEGAHIIGC